ncbi:hypothetical protein R8510_04728 [Ralstonia chuxiongensis]|nr:hypothetical protein R8510_04728 [Ralstonia chuxiongensis]
MFIWPGKSGLNLIQIVIAHASNNCRPHSVADIHDTLSIFRITIHSSKAAGERLVVPAKTVPKVGQKRSLPMWIGKVEARRSHLYFNRPKALVTQG